MIDDPLEKDLLWGTKAISDEIARSRSPLTRAAPGFNGQRNGLRAIHEITDGYALVRLMGLSRIAGTKIDRRRASEPGRQTDVAVGAETGEPRIEPGLRGRALKDGDEGVLG
jgi:hypothetical protein